MVLRWFDRVGFFLVFDLIWRVCGGSFFFQSLRCVSGMRSGAMLSCFLELFSRFASGVDGTLD